MTTHVPAERTAVWCPQRLELGEGARWTGDAIVLTDILNGVLLQAPLDGPGPLREIARLDVPLGAVAPVADRPRTWIAAAGTGIALLEPGGLRWLDRPEDANPRPARMNDAVADPSGRFWAGSMAYDASPGAGSLYRVDADGTVTRVLDGLTIPNGPAFTADGRTMYLADSARGLIHRHQVDPATGDLGAPELFARLDPSTASPDGMTVDAEGCLWTALWGASAVHRYRPDGVLDRVVHLPARQPASVCLTTRRLFITTAAYGLSPTAADGALLALDVDVAGTRAASFRLSPG